MKILKLFTLILFISFISACEEEDNIEDQNFESDEFRVLKLSSGGDLVSNGDQLPAFGLSLELVFSTETNQDAISTGLTVSNGASYSLSYDESGSIMTIGFETLDYEAEYVLSIPAGSYGAAGEVLEDDYSMAFSTDPFLAPGVTISGDPLAVEEGGTSTLTASINEITTEDVVVNLSFGGSATLNEDYTVSAESLTIPQGQTSASIDIAVIDDNAVEGEESIEMSIASVTNGVADNSVVTVNILDNDVALGLILKGILAIEWTTSGNNGGKAIHLKAVEDIADLSVYALGVANNGGGTDSIEFRLPAIAVANGDDILIAREDATIGAYFGSCTDEIEHIIQSDAMNQNGDDAIELYSGTTVIETYGDVNVDGTGEEWEYAGSWAYKLGGEWVYGGVDCAATSTTTQDSNCTYPLCSNAIQLQGIMSLQTGEGAANRERAIHLRANADIADLSVYGIGIANNGGGSDGREMDLPAISVSEGDHILFIRDEDVETIAAYFGTCFDKFDHTAADPGINFNGDDGVELYLNTEVLEIYGSVIDDGTGLPWEYTGSWAYKQNGDLWSYAGVDCSAGSETNDTSNCPYSFCE